jgi:hypothetical protein
VTDEIALTVPRDRRFYDVAHLVVGGLAIRLDLTVDNLADLQLALDGLLPRADGEGNVTVVLRVEGETLTGRIGPFAPDALRRELTGEGGDGWGIHHALEAVFDVYGVDEDAGAAWVTFTMGITPTVVESG